MKIISGIIITVILNFMHGWAGFTNTMKPEQTKMLADLGIGRQLFLQAI